MKIRCPHCHNRIEVLNEDPLTAVDCPSCGSRFSLLAGGDTTSWHAVGTRRIGQFELLEEVGVGHFGSVWKACDTTLDRLVAIKLPRRENLEPEHLEQFLREARAAAQLRHPNVVRVHEVGQANGSVYIVSDFITGCSLKEWLTGQRLTLREAAAICVKIATALEHAHASGVIHRDLKPGNIMLDLGGEPHLMDFGLARRESGEITMTVDGRILGTPAYMSPEQARGDAHRADRRSDVYSLGVVLFELLTGELPFRGDERMLIVQIIKDEPPTPRKLNAQVPRDLETICLKCLQKNPDRRYQTAADLAGDLQQWLDGRPILARPVGRIERAVRWARREPRIAGLAAAIVLVALVGFASVSWQWRQAVAATEQAKKNLDEKEKQRQGRELNFNRAMAAVDRMLVHVGSDELAKVPDIAPVRKAILEDAWKFYQELASERNSDPALQLETAIAAQRVGALRLRLGELPQALDAYEQSVVALEKLHAAQPNSKDVTNALYVAYLGQKDALAARKEQGRALDCLNKIQALLERAGSGGDERAISIKFSIASTLTALGRQQEAEAAYRQTIAMCERHADWNSEDPHSLTSFLLGGWSYFGLRSSLLKRSPPLKAEAEQAALRAIEAFEKLTRSFSYGGANDQQLPSLEVERSLFSGEDQVAQVAEWHADWLQGENREQEAQQFYAKAREWRAKGLARIEHMKVSQAREGVRDLLAASVAAHQARLLKKRDQRDDAIAHYQKAFDGYRRLAETHPRNKAYPAAEVEMAVEIALLLANDPARRHDASALLEEVQEQAQALGKQIPSVQELDYKIFQAVSKDCSETRDKSGMAAAETLVQEARAIADRMAERQADDSRTLEAVGFTYHQLGDISAFVHHKSAPAAEYYERSRVAQEQLVAAKGLNRYSAMNLGWTCQNGGNALFTGRKDGHVVSVAVRGLEIREYLMKQSPGSPSFPAWLKDSYGLAIRALAHCPEPLDADLDKAIQLAGARTTSDPNDGIAWRTLGIAHCRRKQYEQAVTALHKAAEANLEEPAYDQFFLCVALARTGQAEKARQSFEAGSSWVRTNRPSHALLKSLGEEALAAVTAAE